MFKYLVDHAIKNVWCAPRQDNSYVFQPARISKPTGELNRLFFMGRQLTLPISMAKVHVFQVGQVKPEVLGLTTDDPGWIRETWKPLSTVMNEREMQVDLYNDNGVQLPRYKAWYIFTQENSLLIAVTESLRVPVNYSSDLIYLRLYTNAYFESIRSDTLVKTLWTKGKVAQSNQDILDLQNEEADYRAMTGSVKSYVNGFAVDRIDMLNVVVGDEVEFVYDASVKTVVTFPYSGLNNFTSTLDSCYKYLLSFDGDGDQIDYQDDIDVYVYKKTSTKYKGVYFSRNLAKYHRMVTHKDYSIDLAHADNLFGFLRNVTGVQVNSDMVVEVTIRKAGFQRPLIYENNRIFELFKLDYVGRNRALLGLDSSLDIWTAAALEHSGYTQLMRVDMGSINQDLVQRAYGYNSISKLVGNTPIKTVDRNGRQYVPVPHLLANGATAYEYDADGYLIDSYYHPSGTDYYCQNNNARLVEMISGRGSDTPNVIFGKTQIPLPVYHNYRVYMSATVNNIPDNNWVDITGSDKYHVSANKLVWDSPLTDYLLMVRIDSDFLDFNLGMLPVAGNLYFTLFEKEDRGNGLLTYILPVPLGELDIWLNGKSLIKGLDYVLDFPTVYIVNKRHLRQGGQSGLQDVRVRFTGFCTSDLKTDAVDDYGFVEHGFLSNNNRYDVRDDKVMRITVNGKLMTSGDVLFSEEHSGVNIAAASNGSPYQIKDIVVPLKELVDENTYSLRDKAMIIDKKVSDYMTLKLPQPVRNSVVAIPGRYELLSPFFTHLISDLATGQIDTAAAMDAITDLQVMAVCVPYLPLLKYDPITYRDVLDWDYLILHPHNLTTVVTLTLHKYRFLTKVVRLYGHGLIDLSAFVNFTEQ